MRTVTLALPRFAFVVFTRAALAAGVALMVADRLPRRRRRAIASALIAVGAATTAPAIRWISRGITRDARKSRVAVDEHLIGATRFPRKGDDLD